MDWPFEPGDTLYKLWDDDDGKFRFLTYRFDRQTDHFVWITPLRMGVGPMGQRKLLKSDSRSRGYWPTKEEVLHAHLGDLARKINSLKGSLQRATAEYERVRPIFEAMDLTR